jgi:HlyD family secretion protein
VKITKPDEYLRPEMNASVAFISERKAEGASTTAEKPVVMVPSSAVKDNTVFLMLEGRAVKRSVKTGPVSGASVRVEQGLNGGEDLILNPPAGLKDGDKVRQRA